MINEAILTKAGFVCVSEGCYSKQLGELMILLEVLETSFKMIVPCASATIDHEPRIDESIKSCFEGFSRINVSFSDRMITITSLQSDSEITSDELCEILALLERAASKYDLLPVCMRCKRVITVDTVVSNGKAQILCGICNDADVLEKKHKEQIEYFRKLEKDRIKKQNTAFRSLVDILKPCLRIGLVISAVGFVLMWLGMIYLPAFRLMVFVPGFIMGILTMSVIKKDNILRGAVKYLAVTGASILLVSIITGITAFLSYRAVDAISTAGVSNADIPLFGSMAVYNLCFGIGVMLLGQVFMYYMEE